MQHHQRKIEKEFTIYRGLEKPLEFKGFKGKFLYIGAIGIFSSVIVGFGLMASVGMGAGIILLVLGALATILYCRHYQKKGLHNKDIILGPFYIEPSFKFRNDTFSKE